MRVRYYVILDPLRQIMPDVLTVYRLEGFTYQRQESALFSDLGLGLMLWEGQYEGKESTWLRWMDTDGALVLSGRERALEERQRAEEERQRADAAEQKWQEEHQRAERLAEMLRQLGQNPD